MVTIFEQMLEKAGNAGIVEGSFIADHMLAVVAAVCREAGEKGNAAAGEISDTVTTYDGIDAVTNERAASGGADEESDGHLRERILSNLRNPGTGGNAADYKNWALAVDGVERVLVMSPAAGKVTVYITASGNAQAGAGLVSRVKAHIEMLRPLGADVTVVSGTAVPVNIAAKITTTEGADREKLTADIEKAFSDYLAECSFKSSTVSYLKIAELLFTENVSDVTGYSLNGGTDSITLEQGTFPVPGQVVIS